MIQALLFILVPLTFLAGFVAIGLFENDGGIDKLKNKNGRLSRIVFYPLTHELNEDWAHGISQMLLIPAAILFFAMSMVVPQTLA